MLNFVFTVTAVYQLPCGSYFSKKKLAQHTGHTS